MKVRLHQRSLRHVLSFRCQESPAKTALTFLEDGEEVVGKLTFAELELRVKSLARQLQESNLEGERALLLFPPGLEFVVAFLACLYAGVVAVPAYPPHRRRPEERLRAIIDDCQPATCLSLSSLRTTVETLQATNLTGHAMLWMATDDVPTFAAHETWKGPGLDLDSLAFLQYTSGSTADPKGVMVTHGNLLHNEKMISRAFNQSKDSVVAGWLPLYHDMGLIGNVLQPLFLGAQCILMAPTAFLRRPVRWLRAISEHRATTSGGPNFAYDLCTSRISEEDCAGLDLSSWRVAFNGAEPVRGATLRRFAERFIPYGFDPQAFCPCYGLAEGTLLVSSTAPSQGVTELTVDITRLEHHEIRSAQGEDAKTLLSSGRADAEQRVVIVDPEASEPLSDGTVGEIWVQGTSIGQGYWNQPTISTETFEAKLKGSEGPFLRTGDLGFLDSGELFVTGRIKDLIILRGRNLYPQDIEATAARAHTLLRPGCGAAFAVEAEGEERLVLVQEVSRQARGNLEPIFQALKQIVAEEHEASLHDVVLIREGTLLKTSSGKIRRHACRDAYLANELQVAASRKHETEGSATSLGETSNLPVWVQTADLLTLPLEDRASAIGEFLCYEAARLMRRSQLAADKPLGAQGLDSLAAVELAHSAVGYLGIGPDLDELLADLTIDQLARTLARRLETNPSKPVLEATPMAEEFPLSQGQRALVFLERLSPEEGVYNIAAAARVLGALDSQAFETAVGQLAERHPMLRATVVEREGTLRQRITAKQPTLQIRTDLESSHRACMEALRQHAFEPFALEAGPLCRVELVQRGPEEHLMLLTVHHVIADFWSLALLLDDLSRSYEAAKGKSSYPPAQPKHYYSDFVASQERFLADATGLAARDFWLHSLTEAPPVLQLPTDRPRSALASHEGDSVALVIPTAKATAFRQLAKNRGVTLFMGLQALWGTLLHRLSQQPEVWVGTPTAGRENAHMASVVGYFVNPIVLRQTFSEAPTFTTHLDAVRSTLLAALAHQSYPFALLAEALQPDRNAAHSPLFQAMFILQSVPGNPQLASFALGETRGPEPPFGIGPHGAMTWAGLSLDSLKLPRRPAQFDLTLSIAERPSGELVGSLHYASHLFDTTTAQRLAAAFSTLLASATVSPSQSITDLDLLSPPARHQLLVEWNDEEINSAHGGSSMLSLPAAFAAQIERTPGRTALIVDNETLTYRELHQRACRLACYLAHRGAGSGTVVGLSLDRSADLAVALWAVLQTGAAYLPLDPSYPAERLAFVVDDSHATLVLCHRHTAKLFAGDDCRQILVIEDLADHLTEHDEALLPPIISGDLPAYVIYTSGSTGRPKGVVVPQATVNNFFLGMDLRLPISQRDSRPGTWLAVTSVSFDISVLELLYTLTRGFEVVLRKQAAVRSKALQTRLPEQPIGFSLMYFSSDVNLPTDERYRLLMEGVQYADRNGFQAVWTPERHFHEFGGLFPNPSVTSAAIAAVTERVRIRAGSVVLPLHSPIRVAEEWSMVDNLSKGRVDLAFASGWQPDDFVLAPDNYRDRKEVMRKGIETVRELWRGGAVALPNGVGQTTPTRILPAPIQQELPVWITAAGSPDTFALAGELGASVLTHLLGQSLEELAQKIAVYRQTLKEHHGEQEKGHVTLMLHTFVGADLEQVKNTVREPFTHYLSTSFGLMKSLAPDQNLDSMTEDDMASLLARAFGRYFDTSGLFGPPERCLEMIDSMKEIGVDEVACLIDFGVDTDTVLASFDHLAQVRDAANIQTEKSPTPERSICDQILEFGVSHLQCTPSLARTLLTDPRADNALAKLSCLMVGGEALPADLASSLGEKLTTGRLLNMYGPTETTIWSSVARTEPKNEVTLGRPIANTSLAVADRHLQPLPLGVPGELTIGGLGVVRGYHGRPALTAERFVADPWSRRPGARLYRTGDLVRQRQDGPPEFLGRLDHQVKIHGHRIELGEIETALRQWPDVLEAVVLAREDHPGDPRLVAYVVPRQATAGLPEPSAEKQKKILAGRDSYRLPNGLTVAHLSSPQTNAIYREIYVEDVYRRHGVTLEDGAIIFDVGANIGLFTLFVHEHCKNPRVFAFEPIPPTFDKLATNVDLFDLAAETFNLGISNREETANFTFYPEMAGLSGRFAEGDQDTTRAIIRSWVERMAAKRQIQKVDEAEIDALVQEYLESEVFDCQLRSLSSVIRERGIAVIDYLKVDVEGAELQVLQGIDAEDWPKIRQVVLEVHSKDLLEASTRILEEHDFELAVDEFIPVEDQIDYVYMVYAMRTGIRTASSNLSAPSPATGFSEADLRVALATTLPEPMIPTHIVVLDRLPLLPNGKIDRQALPKPGGSAKRRTPFVPPGDGLEEQVAEIWCRLLGIDEISIHDNFFETGGNSLLLMQAHGQLRANLHSDISLVDLMRHPTVSSLAGFLAKAGGTDEAKGSTTKSKKLNDRMARQRKAFGRRRKRHAGTRGGEAR